MARLPQNYFKNDQNRRLVLEKIGMQLGVKHPSDWGKIKIQQVLDNGGFKLLRIYGNSLYKALVSTFTDVNWKKEWFLKAHNNHRRFWTKPENQRAFLEEFAKKNEIKKPKDWSKITVKQFAKSGGSTLLIRYYGHSLFKALKKLYPEVEWKKEWFPNVPLQSKKSPGFWVSESNRRNFLSKFAKEHGITKPHEWGNISTRTLINHGGGTIIFKYGSVFNALRASFKEVEWKVEWFPMIPKYRATYWSDMKNQREFMDNLQLEYRLHKLEDWKRITATVIRKKGGYGLLSKYQNSLIAALSNIYPFHNWKMSTNSNGEITLKKNIGFMFPN